MSKQMTICLLSIATIITLTCSAGVICIGEPNITPIERMMRAKVPGSFYFADENRCDTIIEGYRVSNYICQDSSHITLYGGVEDKHAVAEGFSNVNIIQIQDIQTHHTDTILINRGIYHYSPYMKTWKARYEEYTLYGGVDISASKDTCIIKIPLFISDTDTYGMFRLRYYHGNYDFCEIDEVIGGSDEAWGESIN